ncbi:MAG: MFS transporter [Parvibaculum sp.]
MPQKTRINTTKLMAFAGPAIPISALGLPLTVFIPQFFAGPMGLGLATVGTIFLIARFWDVITDPIMGAVSDQISTKWGKRRHWIVASVPILMLSVFMVFLPQENPSAYYLFGWMMVLYIGWTMITLSHMSWGAELDDDYNQRSRIQGFREGFVILGVPLVMMIPVIIESFSEASDPLPQQVAAMGIFVIVLLPLTVFLSVRTVPERARFRNTQKPVREQFEGIFRQLSFRRIKAALVPLKSNNALQRLVAADFFSGVSGASLGTLFLYEVRYVWEAEAWAGRFLLIYFIAGVAFVPVVLKVSYKIGKHRALIAAASFTVIFVPFTFIVPPGQPLIVAAMLVFLGINVGSTSILYRAIMADVGDLDEVETGQRRTGLFYSLLTFTQKTGAAIAVGVVFWTLDAIGFQASGENTPEAVRGLALIFFGIPMACNLIVILLMWGFPIDFAKQQELRRIIDERQVEEWEADEGHIP